MSAMERKLYRSSTKKYLGGVCGGLAEFFQTDPVFFRVLFLIMLLTGGSGILVYIVLWIFIPRRPYSLNENPSGNFDYFRNDSDTDTMREAQQIWRNEAIKKRKRKLGIAMISIGVLILLNKLLPQNYLLFLWPLILILVGVVIIKRNKGLEG